jgi:hypothetical protein
LGYVLLTHFRSAELEITVPMLVQVDKLVQLIESPVFTCERTPLSLDADGSSPSAFQIFDFSY